MIEIKNISKVFNRGKEDEVRALNDVSLTIRQGEFVMIIGANGSGKSTLLNLLLGAERPTAGYINVNGKDVSNIPEHKRSRMFARVFQNPAMGTAPDLTVLENFRLASLRSGSRNPVIGNNKAFRELVEAKVQMLDLGLEKKLDKTMGSLSGGQRQALTLLMGVMDKTDLLLMDEPTAALDPRSSEKILQLTDTLNREMGITIMFITHALKDAHKYGSRLLLFKEGALAKDIDKSAKDKLKPEDIFYWF